MEFYSFEKIVLAIIVVIATMIGRMAIIKWIWAPVMRRFGYMIENGEPISQDNQQLVGVDASASLHSSSVPRWKSEKPLRNIAEAFKELEAAVNSQTAEVEVAQFCQACSFVSPLIGYLGIAFKFAEMDYVSKVHDLAEASKSISTLQVLVDRDVEADCVRKVGSHSRNLLRVKRAIELIRVLFEQILVTKGNSLKDPVSKAYQQVFAPHHGWVIRKAVASGLSAIPTKEQLLNKANEDENSAKVQMQNYVAASAPVILYIDKLFQTRNLGVDW